VGSQEKVFEGGNIFGKMSEGDKIVKWVKKGVRGDKIDKNCPRVVKSAGKTVRGGKIGQNCLVGSHEKNMSKGGKKSCFVSEGVRENKYI